MTKVKMIAAQIFHSSKGNPIKIASVDFTAAINKGDTSGKSRIGSNTSLIRARRVIPATRLPMAEIPKSVMIKMSSHNPICSGISRSRNSQKRGTMIICAIKRKRNPLTHLLRKISDLSTGADKISPMASNSFSRENDRCNPKTEINRNTIQINPEAKIENVRGDSLNENEYNKITETPKAAMEITISLLRSSIRRSFFSKAVNTA